MSWKKDGFGPNFPFSLSNHTKIIKWELFVNLHKFEEACDTNRALSSLFKPKSRLVYIIGSMKWVGQLDAKRTEIETLVLPLPIVDGNVSNTANTFENQYIK